MSLILMFLSGVFFGGVVNHFGSKQKYILPKLTRNHNGDSLFFWLNYRYIKKIGSTKWEQA